MCFDQHFAMLTSSAYLAVACLNLSSCMVPFISCTMAGQSSCQESGFSGVPESLR